MPEPKKESRFKKIIKSPQAKKSQKAETIAGGTAAAATFGAGMIDLRPKANLKAAPYLGDTYDQVSHKLKVGDVLIGSSTTGNETLKDQYNMFKDSYLSARKAKEGRISAIRTGSQELNRGALLSKVSDPDASHSTLLTSNKGNTSYSGSGNSHITREIPRDNIFLEKVKRRNETHHFTVMRPKSGVSQLPDIERKIGSDALPDYVAEKAGGRRYYKGNQGIKAQIKDWLLPKFNKVEKVKTDLVKKQDLCTVGGVCSTTAAQFGNRTVGGKVTADVIPGDFYRTSDYEVVGKIGKGKSSGLAKTIFKVPKYLVKGTAALAVGGTVYGGVKGYKAIKSKFSNNKDMTKKAFLENIYNDTFNNELLLITGK